MWYSLLNSSCRIVETKLVATESIEPRHGSTYDTAVCCFGAVLQSSLCDVCVFFLKCNEGWVCEA